MWWLLQCIPGAVVRKQPWRGEEIGKRPSSNPGLVLKPGWSRIISVPIFALQTLQVPRMQSSPQRWLTAHHQWGGVAN